MKFKVLETVKKDKTKIGQHAIILCTALAMGLVANSAFIAGMSSASPNTLVNHIAISDGSFDSPFLHLSQTEKSALVLEATNKRFFNEHRQDIEDYSKRSTMTHVFKEVMKGQLPVENTNPDLAYKEYLLRTYATKLNHEEDYDSFQEAKSVAEGDWLQDQVLVTMNLNTVILNAENAMTYEVSDEDTKVQDMKNINLDVLMGNTAIKDYSVYASLPEDVKPVSNDVKKVKNTKSHFKNV